jgi:hypothetical protein
LLRADADPGCWIQIHDICRVAGERRTASTPGIIWRSDILKEQKLRNIRLSEYLVHREESFRSGVQ